MLTHSLLPRLADDLHLRLIETLPGGEFGAAIVRDATGRELVLKATSKRCARQLARSGVLTERLRDRGYPAPLQIANGIARGACWSLQERIPGDVPEVMTTAHARQLTALLRMQRKAAGCRRPWPRAARMRVRAWSHGLASNAAAAQMASELASVVDGRTDVSVRGGDVVHNDFSHRNYLAIGDDVTGVVDWDLASIGDWRLDLVSLAYWCALEPSHVASDASAIVAAAVRDACPARLRAMFAAYIALRHLDYVARAHPGDLPSIVAAIDERVAGWWRHRPPSRQRAVA
jgi:aminoglycoside phosphotransferase (APT) family kinase protein